MWHAMLPRIHRMQSNFFCSVSSWEQRCNRYETGIGIVSYHLYFGPDTGISIFFVGEKIHCLIFGFTNEKKNCLRFFFNTARYLVYQINFWWDRSSETIQNTFSLSKDDTCLLSQESETTQIRSFWVFKFWDNTQYWVIHVSSRLCCTVAGSNPPWLLRDVHSQRLGGDSPQPLRVYSFLQPRHSLLVAESCTLLVSKRNPPWWVRAVHSQQPEGFLLTGASGTLSATERDSSLPLRVYALNNGEGFLSASMRFFYQGIDSPGEANSPFLRENTDT
jgi:hypothetical protein